MADQATIIDAKESEQTSVISKDAPMTKKDDLQSKANPPDDLLKGITAEDGRQKYSTIESALKSIPAAQDHIRRLEAEALAREQELERLRQVAEKSRSVDELAQILRNQSGEAQPASAPGLTREELTGLVANIVEQREITKFRKANQDKAASVLIQHFGSTDAAKQKYVEMAKDKGLSVDTLNEIAAQNPKELFRLLDIPEDKITPERISGTVNPRAIENQQDLRPRQKKSVMSGGTTKDLVEAFRAARPK